MSDRFCVNCAWHREGDYCGSMRPVPLDLVTGEPPREVARMTDCHWERGQRQPGDLVFRCGPEGQFFKPKE